MIYIGHTNRQFSTGWFEHTRTRDWALEAFEKGKDDESLRFESSFADIFFKQAVSSRLKKK